MRFILGLLAVAGYALGAAPEMERARALYERTGYEQSLAVLQAIPVKDGPVNALIGRNCYMLGDYKRAAEALEKAVSTDPANAEFALWLGRAYGRRAETANPFAAPGLAVKARQYFEKAVQLNPRYLEALSDLFEYYLDAPGFLGGGMDKAEATAARMGRLDPAEGHGAQAVLAEKRKQYGAAEEHLRQAIEASPKDAGRLIDLAEFLSRRGRIQDADQCMERAARIAGDSPKLLYAKAKLYIQQHRNLEVARGLLKRYISSDLTPDDPPRGDAAKLLRQAGGSL